MKIIYTIFLLIILNGVTKAQSMAETNIIESTECISQVKPGQNQSFLHFYLILRAVMHIRSYPNISPYLCRLDVMPENEAEPTIATPQKQVVHQSPIINIKWKSDPRNSQPNKSTSY